MRRSRPLVLGLTVALLAAPLAAQTITPRFAWTPGQVARITTTMTLVAEGDDAPRETQVLHHDDHVAVGPDPRGVALVWSGAHTWHRDAVAVSQEHDPAADPMRRAGAIVDARGRLLAFRDTAALRRFADSSKAAMLERLTDLPPEGRDMMRFAFTPASFGARAMKAWYEDVGQWVERSWSPRDSLVDSIATPIPPGTPGAMVMRRSRRFDGEVACPTGHAGRCWSFTETTTMSSSGVHPAVAAQAKALGAPGMLEALAEMGDMRLVTTTVRIVDAADFRPLLQRRTSATTSSGAERVAGRMELRRTYRWE